MKIILKVVFGLFLMNGVFLSVANCDKLSIEYILPEQDVDALVLTVKKLETQLEKLVKEEEEQILLDGQPVIMTSDFLRVVAMARVSGQFLEKITNMGISRSIIKLFKYAAHANNCGLVFQVCSRCLWSLEKRKEREA